LTITVGISGCITCFNLVSDHTRWLYLHR